MTYSAEPFGVLSLLPGRVRVHLHGWTGGNRECIEQYLSRVKGVENVQVNSVTGNALLRFDPRTTDAEALVGELHEAWDCWLAAQQREPSAAARSARGRGPSTSRLLRVGVRGLLGHAAVDSLWFAAGFLGQSLGLPLAGLGPLHVLMDVAIWTMALRSGTGSSPSAAANTQAEPARASAKGVLAQGR